jgi:type II secretory pathway pseudopilin PulG
MDEVDVPDVQGERGFTLLEAFIAMSILAIALMAMAQVLFVGIAMASTSTPALVAREKAREAIESVHTARDTFIINWAGIRNQTAPTGCPAGTTGNGGGVFRNEELDMTAPGPDGLVNTADDAGQEVTPGPDGQFGTDDDVPLTGFTRQIMICDVAGNPDLRQITVIVRYDGSAAIGERRREYRLTTLISRFS